jgi:hypothetical protein
MKLISLFILVTYNKNKDKALILAPIMAMPVPMSTHFMIN